jgi:hypothetical protein
MSHLRQAVTSSMLATTFVVTVAVALHAACASAQTTDDLRKRIERLEQSTREQVELLMRQIERHEAERAEERRASEERERTIQVLKEQVAQQQSESRESDPRLAKILDLESGARQTNNNIKFLTSLGFERPLFDNQALGDTRDCGTGCLSGFPTLSAGIGLETGLPSTRSTTRRQPSA